MKKRILIYGDSNTWGSNGQGLRYPTAQQWVNILADLLGSDFDIVQEGLCGRIAGDHDTEKPYRNGRSGYEIAIRSASPFDYLVVALGTNDIKQKYGLNESDIIEDLSRYRDITQEYNDNNEDMEDRFKAIFYVNIANYNPAKFDVANHELTESLRSKIAETFEKEIDVSDLEHSEDGLHYSPEDHKKVARKVYEKIKEIVG